LAIVVLSSGVEEPSAEFGEPFDAAGSPVVGVKLLLPVLPPREEPSVIAVLSSEPGDPVKEFGEPFNVSGLPAVGDKLLVSSLPSKEEPLGEEAPFNASEDVSDGIALSKV
jgi:hypothetical protein